MSLDTALGGMRNIQQWFIWRLEWDAEEGKYQKTPCAHDGSVYKIDAGLPSNWSRYESVKQRVAELNASEQCADRALQYALGFWMTADCGYWFLDIDKCVEDGALTQFASAMVAAFPGAMFEWSSSRRGVHVFGKTQHPVPPHRSRDAHKLYMEFYTQDRGVAFGLDGQASGNADTCHDQAIAQLVERFFPPRKAGEEGDFDKPRADWRGPADDDELIRRALQARASAAAAFGGKATFAQLWQGEVEKDSSADMALASHLAFWTGCDAPRIERLMRKSGLKRAKWDEHRTYLRGLTIENACIGCREVYKEPQRDMSMFGQPQVLPAVQGEVLPPVTTTAVQGQLVSTETLRRIDELLDAVSAAGNLDELINQVVPQIHAANIPRALIERLVKAVNKRLEIWQADMPIGQVRAMLSPPIVRKADGNIDAPLWVQKHCYNKENDKFYDMEKGIELSVQGFIAEYGRHMPAKDNGAKENAAEWALHRWCMRTVHHVGYRPDQGPYFTYDGLDYANSYSESSVPALAATYTEAGVAGITAFQTHLFDMCGRRQDVFTKLLQWLAHNVQRPGIKIRWSPILKGTQGDAKSLISAVMRAAMGNRNVRITGNATLTASGGFTDWAVGRALNVIEEIWLVGKERHKLYNATKEFITNDVVSINPKGSKGYDTFNTTNHIAFSNHNDALPLEAEDRRWFVIFTPWANLAAMRDYCGLTPEAWQARTDAIDYAWKNCAGELRAWFMSMDLSGFDKDGSAMMTPEKQRMMATAKDSAEEVAEQIIADGAEGISVEVFSSLCLSNLLRIRSISEGFELPKGPALNHMLTRMGYSKVSKLVKWRGHPHTIWIRNGISEDNDNVRAFLNRTLTNANPS